MVLYHSEYYIPFGIQNEVTIVNLSATSNQCISVMVVNKTELGIDSAYPLSCETGEEESGFGDYYEAVDLETDYGNKYYYYSDDEYDLIDFTDFSEIANLVSNIENGAFPGDSYSNIYFQEDNYRYVLYHLEYGS